MQHDDLNKKIVEALEDKAKHHSKKHAVMENVFQKIEEKHHHRFNRWGIAGFALAAAITSITILPTSVIQDTPESTVKATPKLSPQLADDLEMLLVLGEDTHDS